MTCNLKKNCSQNQEGLTGIQPPPSKIQVGLRPPNRPPLFSALPALKVHNSYILNQENIIIWFLVRVLLSVIS